MRKRLTLLALLALFTAAACTKQPPSLWFEGETLDAALVQAKAGEKLVLIDFYAPT